MSEEPKQSFEDGYPAMRYRPSDIACGYEYEIVKSSAEERALGHGWFKSPADFGIETCPGKKPDPKITKKREEFLASQGVKRKSRQCVPSGDDAA